MRQLSAKEQLDLSFSVTAILSESTDLQAAVNEVLARMGIAFDFDAGSFWVVHELRTTLRCATFWTKEGLRFPNFELVSRVRGLAFGQGLPGKAWETRRPVCLSDLANIPRALVARIDGLQTGFAFPAFRARRVFGIFEFFSRDNHDFDDETTNFFAALGVQIGVFLEHYGINDNVIEDEGKVRLAAERSVDAVLTIDEHSNVIYANSANHAVFGWRPEELVGDKLTKLIPQPLRGRHEHGLHRYITSGERHLDWSDVRVPALHKDGHQMLVTLAFGEFWRKGNRVFTGFARLRDKEGLG